MNVDSSGLLFVCAGAFEGLYDAVYHRVTAGKDQGALKPVTVVDEDGRAREELQFSLRDWLKTEDLFEYGVSPQFLSRFDAVVLLEPLGEEALAQDLRGGRASRACGSRRPTSRASAAGSRSPRTPRGASCARRRASRASAPARSRRSSGASWARSSSTPTRRRAPNGVVRIDLARVEEALARDRQARLGLDRLRLGPDASAA